MPREVLDPWLDELIADSDGAMRDVLAQLKNRPTFAEQWPNQFEEGLRRGKNRIHRLEKIRNDSFTLRDILSERKDALAWWDSI
jgi:hypothetical protein